MRRGHISNVGDRIYSLRKKNGLSQEELADKIKVSRQSISKWETNAMTPGTEQIAALAKLFDVSIDYLVLNEEDRKEVAASNEQMSAKLPKKNHRVKIIVTGIVITLFVTVISIVVTAIAIISGSPNSGDVTASVNHLHFTNKALIIIGVIIAVLSVLALCFMIYKHIKRKKKEGSKFNEQKETQKD